MTQLILSDDDMHIVYYELSNVVSIVTGTADEFYNDHDIAGNGLVSEDVMIVVYFKDGTEATFSSNWAISFC